MKALDNIIDSALEKTDKVKKLNTTVETTQQQRDQERRRADSLSQQNHQLRELLAIKTGRLIFDRAQQELQIGLTKELDSILTAMRERVALEFCADQNMADPNNYRQLCFSITVPAIDIRFHHNVSMCDMAEYHRSQRF